MVACVRNGWVERFFFPMQAHVGRQVMEVAKDGSANEAGAKVGEYLRLAAGASAQALPQAPLQMGRTQPDRHGLPPHHRHIPEKTGVWVILGCVGAGVVDGLGLRDSGGR